MRRMVTQQYFLLARGSATRVGRAKIRILTIAELNRADRAWLEVFYWQQVRPVLTPLAIDPAHPFPQLLNKSLNLIVRLEMRKNNETPKHMAVVQPPPSCRAPVRLPRRDGRRDYVSLGELIGHYRRIFFRARRSLAGGRSASRATASSTSTKKRKAIC